MADRNLHAAGHAHDGSGCPSRRDVARQGIHVSRSPLADAGDRQFNALFLGRLPERPARRAVTEAVRKAIKHTFDEDKFVLESQAERLRENGHPPIPSAAIKVDVAPVQGRRLLASLVEKEQRDPTFISPPVLMADDNRIGLPPLAA